MSTFEIEEARFDDQEVVVVELSGRANYETISSLLAELNLRIEQRTALRVLMDESDLQAGFMGASQVRDLADRWKATSALHAARIAVYAPGLTIFGLNRMFQGLAGKDAEDTISVFRNRVDAIAWLVASKPRTG
jgi:hypothetical protein